MVKLFHVNTVRIKLPQFYSKITACLFLFYVISISKSKIEEFNENTANEKWTFQNYQQTPISL